MKIGSYTIERVLGRGGFGVVYAGVDGRLGRRAAIKQLLPALTKERDIVERFFNEARAAAGIDHPGIVEIYDVGWHDDGSAYFAMKLLDGESLGARLRARRRLAIDAACAIARQIASALVAAHARGIVHRDLKPDNVILVPDDEVAIGERATLLDFGIAKLREDDSLSSRTRTGVVMGTPSYMAPEQCRGAGAVDGRADVYALGCILFEALAGRPPFVAAGSGAVLGMHQFVAPPDVRTLRDDVPTELAAIVRRTLAKEPGDRPAVEELAAALRPFAANGGISERLPPGTIVGRYIEPPPAPPRRRRHHAIVAGALAGAVLGAVALFAWPRGQGRAPAVATAPIDAASNAVDAVTPSDAAAGATPGDAAAASATPSDAAVADAARPNDAAIAPAPAVVRPRPPLGLPRPPPQDPALGAALAACARGDLADAAHRIGELPPAQQAIARAACARGGVRVDIGSTPSRPPPPPPRMTRDFE